jgi:hypothetical protein
MTPSNSNLGRASRSVKPVSQSHFIVVVISSVTTVWNGVPLSTKDEPHESLSIARTPLLLVGATSASGVSDRTP